MIPGAANPLLLASAQAAAAYNIERSVRFNLADSASLTRASYFGSGTFSAWVKRCRLNAAQTIISGVSFNASNQLNSSIAVFRDPSAWMHIVVSSLGTYVNGASVASGSAITPSAIGSGCDLYIADVHFIDGQALGPTSFGEFDANGVWQPKAYTGTYGTNGFHLPFSDNSIAAALGTDTSGAGNNWTVNNISVAAGAGNDSLVDTPTSYGTDTGTGGEVRGNYCTLNPLFTGGVIVPTRTQTVSNGNLYAAATSNSEITGTIAVSSGKWYYEVLVEYSPVGDGMGPGFCIPATGQEVIYRNETTAVFRFDGAQSVYGANYTTGDIIGVALDLDTTSITFYKNGVSQGVAKNDLPAGTYVPFIYTRASTGDTRCFVNFGQRPFAYPAPIGFKALCTTNLPEPQTITTSGSYTGNGLADGPFVYLNGVPTAMTVNGTAVTFGTHADKLSNGLKLRTTSTTYNQNAATYNYSVTSTGPTFKTARAQSN